MYDRFTDQSRKVMQLANRAAQDLNHQYIGAEHILLGLIDQGESVALDVLKKLSIDVRRLRGEAERVAQAGAYSIDKGKLPQVPRAKKVIEYSMEEARELQHDYVGTEHLLLGILREQEGVAARILMNEGLAANAVREEIKHFLGSNLPANLTPTRSIALRSHDLIADLPAEARQAIERSDAEIDRMNSEKMDAVRDQDFPRAAVLRDEVDKLTRAKSAVVGDWMANRTVERSWLTDNGGAVLNLARQISGDRSWSLLPTLADALESAGCTDAELCDHCRQAGPHSDHCWVVELLLFHAARE